jgi:hypothetical protein
MHNSSPQDRSLARAWILLCFALALHVFDEATTGLLRVYNPTVLRAPPTIRLVADANF